MIKCEFVVIGSQIIIGDYTVVNDYGMIIIYLKNDRIDDECWRDERGLGSLEQAIAYCLGQSK